MRQQVALRRANVKEDHPGSATSNIVNSTILHVSTAGISGPLKQRPEESQKSVQFVTEYHIPENENLVPQASHL